jgi:16S rRNA (cytosine967-C5)-methyltransferase
VAGLREPLREPDALADLAGAADLVLVDAPCSGSGTWRRNPEARWRLTPDRLERLAALQSRLLDLAAALVAPGGALVYAVCSLLAAEGREQAAAFSARSSLVEAPPLIPAGRAAGPGLLLTPAHDGTDGFFVARWRRPC